MFHCGNMFDLMITSLETPSGHSPTLWHFLVYEPEGKWNIIPWPTHGDMLPGVLHTCRTPTRECRRISTAKYLNPLDVYGSNLEIVGVCGKISVLPIGPLMGVYPHL